MQIDESIVQISSIAHRRRRAATGRFSGTSQTVLGLRGRAVEDAPPTEAGELS